MTIFERLKSLVKKVLGDDSISLDSLTLESRIKEDVGLNSISLLYLVLAIEEEFDVEMHNSSIEKFETIKDVVNYIQENE